MVATSNSELNAPNLSFSTLLIVLLNLEFNHSVSKLATAAKAVRDPELAPKHLLIVTRNKISKY